MADLHAHWDCSRGMSVESILAACFGAAANHSEALSLAQALEETVLPFVFNGCVTRCKLQLEQKGSSTLSLVYEVEFSENAQHQPSYEKMDELIAHADGIPAHVRDCAGAVLREVVSKEAPSKKNFLKDQAREFILVVGTLWVLDSLSVKTVSCGPVPTTLSSEDETRLLSGLPIQITENDAPFVSPIAIDLLRVLSRACSTYAGRSPPMILRKLSRGTYNIPIEHISSLAIGECCGRIPSELSSNCWKFDQMSVLEANIDDCTSERLSFCVELLLLAGAADAWVTPIVMKKGRAAHTLHCLCQAHQRDCLLTTIFRHCATLGVRIKSVDRASLARKTLPVQTKWKNVESEGLVNVKVGYLADKVVSIKAEFDDCRRISLATGEPIRDVSDCAERLMREILERRDILDGQK
jgi:uncharacterized protein (DUF111 family)